VVLEEARQRKLLSEDHFTVDGTIGGLGSLKSFSRKVRMMHTLLMRKSSVDFQGKTDE